MNVSALLQPSNQKAPIMSIETKVTFVWIRVGDGNPEPAALEGEFPNRKVTTIGCPDPYFIDGPDCPAWVCYNGTYHDQAVIEPPEETVKAKEAVKRERAYQKSLKESRHSYVGFGRKQ